MADESTFERDLERLLRFVREHNKRESKQLNLAKTLLSFLVGSINSKNEALNVLDELIGRVPRQTRTTNQTRKAAIGLARRLAEGKQRQEFLNHLKTVLDHTFDSNRSQLIENMREELNVSGQSNGKLLKSLDASIRSLAAEADEEEENKENY